MPGGEEFDVAVGALDGGGGEGEVVGVGEVGGGEGEDFCGDALVDGGVADDAFAFVCLLFGGLKLGFDEGDEVALGLQERPDMGEDLGLGDEGDVHHYDVVVGLGEEVGGDLACVDALKVRNAGVVAEFGVELAVAYVYAGYVGGTVLEEAVGEAACGGTDVEGVEARDGEGVGVEKAL